MPPCRLPELGEGETSPDEGEVREALSKIHRLRNQLTELLADDP
jgi:hypothetical protein